MAKYFNEIVQDQSQVEKYNPYHGKDGKFTTGGGSKTTVPDKNSKGRSVNSSESVKRTLSRDMDDNSPAGRKLQADCVKTAQEAVSRATKIEPKITGDLQAITSANGGKLVGLEYKTKGADSLTRKLVTECKELSDDLGRDISPDQALKRMFDTNRYTVSDSEDRLAKTTRDTIEKLESQGYKVQRIKNTLKDKDASYRGVNCVVQTPEGSLFELQFHTPTSLEVKEVNHKMYETQRKDDTPLDVKRDLGIKMSENARNIPTPKDIESIPSFNNLPVFKSANPVYLFYNPG